jgi:dCTP deaminase
MAVLSKLRILDRLQKRVTEADSLVITPLLKMNDAFDSDSIDLRLGFYFLLPKTPPELFFDPSSRISESSYTRVHVPPDGHLVIPAHQTVLGATLEFIKLPHDVSGQILTKSSVARMFMVIETAPWIHPYYRGCLTLEIANVSNTPVQVYPGMQIGQLILMETPGAEVPASIKSSYFGPIYPEPPHFKNVLADLESIGVRTKPQKP